MTSACRLQEPWEGLEEHEESFVFRRVMLAERWETLDFVQMRLEKSGKQAGHAGWEPGKSHSRRQKVQGVLEKPPGLGSQQCQALWQLRYIHELVGSSLILESGCDVPIFQMRKQRLQRWIQSHVPSHRTLHSPFAHQGLPGWGRGQGGGEW